MEPFPGVDQPSFAHPVDGSAVHQHADAHGDVQSVATVQQLLPHTASLPAVPVRNVGKFRFTLLRLQKTSLGQQIRFSTAIAGEGGSFAGHGAFVAAVRAFVKNAVQSVGAERLGNANLLLLLVTEVVKGEAFRQQRVDLCGAGLGDFLRGKEIFHIRGNIYLAQL